MGKRRNTMFSANCVMLIDGIKGFRYMLVLFEQVTFHWFVKGWNFKRSNISVSSVQSLSHVQIFETPWIAARQASLSITNSWSSLKFMSIQLVMPVSHLILCHPLLFLPPIPPSIRVFTNESTLRMREPKYRSLASASVLPMNTQDWSPLGWTGWISL